MHSPKVVLVSTKGYLPSRDDALLQELIKSKIELFCAVGIGAEQWEDALDWLCIGRYGDGKHLITTTAHTDETVEEVIAFAELFKVSTPGQIEILYA